MGWVPRCQDKLPSAVERGDWGEGSQGAELARSRILPLNLAPMGLREEAFLSPYCKPTGGATSSGSIRTDVRHGFAGVGEHFEQGLDPLLG